MNEKHLDWIYFDWNLLCNATYTNFGRVSLGRVSLEDNIINLKEKKSN